MTIELMKELEVGDILLDIMKPSKWRDVVKCKVVEIAKIEGVLSGVDNDISTCM